MEKRLSELKWVALFGRFDYVDQDLIYVGREYDPPARATPEGGLEQGLSDPGKFVYFGTPVFNQNFAEGRIRCQIEFDEVDHRTNGSLVLQYDPKTGEMLTFGLGGGGPLFGLRL
jgi:hypothetical protein